MRINESTIRRIIRQEARRTLLSVNEAAHPEELEAVYGTQRPEDWEEAQREAYEDEDEDEEPRMRGSWSGGYSKGVGGMKLDTPDQAVSAMWDEWTELTKSLLRRVDPLERLPLTSDAARGGTVKDMSVGEMMKDTVDYFRLRSRS